MDFKEELNHIMEELECSGKELAQVSKLSPGVISRYKKGTRIPKIDSPQLDKIISSLSMISIKKNKSLTKEVIKERLINTLNQNNIDFETFKNNLNTLITSLKINAADLARYIGFDASYLSKIRNGERKPSNLNDFTFGIAKYISEYLKEEKDLEIIAELLNKTKEEIKDKETCFKLLNNWIVKKGETEEDNSINTFLTKLDEFDLNEYIKVIHFDKLKVPTIPISIPKSKMYFGLDGFKESQIDVLKGIVLSKSKEDVFFYSNMSMIEASKDLDFTKKFMIGLAFLLKKGIHLNMVHDLDRPWKELMLGLTGWIPLYMTGNISPYYFKNNSNLIFSCLKCVGGTTALTGSCITGVLNHGTFYITNKKEEVNHELENAKLLLKKVNPLMNIYNIDKKNEYENILKNNLKEIGTRRNIYYSLPIHSISEELLLNILKKNHISKNIQKEILEYHKKEQIKLKDLLKNNKVIDEISILTKEQFERNPLYLSLSNTFIEEKIKYSYEDYLKHIELTKKIKNKNYTLKTNHKIIFKNINIFIIEKKQVIISKENSPMIHFVIHHPKLIQAIEKFELPIEEK